MIIPFQMQLLFSPCFISLCGFGVFLNEESILAVCFFIFLFLMIRNWIHYDTLKDLKQSIRSGLVVSLIQAEWQIIKNTYFDFEKTSIIKQHKRDDFTCI
jgi:hypothetical protein